MDLSGIAATQPIPDHSAVAALRSLGESKGEPLGEKVIDGIKTRGFRSNIGAQKMSVWADEKTALPVRIESTIPMGDGEAVVIMDKFEVDAPLDDALFSLDPPADYTIAKEKLKVDVGSPEQAVVNLLRLYAKRSGGSFPAKINDPQSYAEVFKPLKATAATNPNDPELMQMAAQLGAGFGAVFGLMNNQHGGYAGADVKLGEKDKIVFWYKPPQGNTYRAIFGDLRIEDVTADRLPAAK
jgi:hypothetical protein